jgi:hypothetical protein
VSEGKKDVKKLEEIEAQDAATQGQMIRLRITTTQATSQTHLTRPQSARFTAALS